MYNYESNFSSETLVSVLFCSETATQEGPETQKTLTLVNKQHVCTVMFL